MKRSTQLAVLMIGILMLVLLALHQRQVTVVGDEPRKPKTVPTDQIYTTCDEYSPKYLNYGQGHPDLQTFINFTASFKSGASNAFLVRGDDVVAAMKASYQIFGRGVSASTAAQPDENTRSDHVWFGGFLGIAGSSPKRWSVNAIEIQDKSVRLIYTSSKDRITSTDSHEYLVLTPLGKISKGQYQLELFDADQKEITLMRKVVVK